jgi:outer membrane lipoprotein SlyB
MVKIVVIVCCVLFIGSVAMAASGSKGGSAAAGRSGDRERLLALEFRGVVVENERVAHAFDAGYSCRVKIESDDGANVVMTTSIYDQHRFPVGTRVVKRIGQPMPEPTTETESPRAWIIRSQ